MDSFGESGDAVAALGTSFRTCCGRKPELCSSLNVAPTGSDPEGADTSKEVGSKENVGYVFVVLCACGFSCSVVFNRRVFEP